jgi:hypothetical protein
MQLNQMQSVIEAPPGKVQVQPDGQLLVNENVSVPQFASLFLTVTVYETVEPADAVWLDGERVTPGFERVHVGGGVVTVKLYVAERVIPPPVPDIVIVYVPVGVVEEVEIVAVELQVGLQLVGLKEQDAPAGRLEQENETDCVLPLINVAVTVVLVDCP